MRSRYILAPEAALDLVEIWRYIKKKASREMADRVETTIRERIVFLAKTQGAGHWRKDLTDEPVKFFPAYSYLIVYRPETSRCRSSPFSTAIATLNVSSPSASDTRPPGASRLCLDPPRRPTFLSLRLRGRARILRNEANLRDFSFRSFE